jgi:hypothetical protein
MAPCISGPWTEAVMHKNLPGEVFGNTARI